MIDENKLKKEIGIYRYEHSKRVSELAMKLAVKYDVDEEKARIAGLLHDCAKYGELELLLKKASDFDIIDDKITEDNPELIHGVLGSKIAKHEYGIDDIEILQAIKNHTTGSENMTKLDKIIYIADYAEPVRNFPGVENVRKLMYEDLNLALIKAMDQTLKHLIDIGAIISVDTLKGRNYLLKELKMEG